MLTHPSHYQWWWETYYNECWETTNNVSATLMKSLLIRNSDVKSPDPEGCEHDGSKVTIPHEGDTTKDELGDLRWLMISMKAQRSHIPKELQITWSNYYLKMTCTYSFGWWTRSNAKDHPTHWTSHLESAAECTKTCLNNQSLRATRFQGCKNSVLIFWGDLP